MREPAPLSWSPDQMTENMKTYIVARDYEDGHQLVRFVSTDDERELRKHWTRIARVEDMHNGILQLCECCEEETLAWAAGANVRDGMSRRNTLTQCRMVFGSAGTVDDRSDGVMTEADGLPLNRPDAVSAFGDTTTIRPKLFASVRIFPGAKSNVSPIFFSRCRK
jgi:hypothetical protein